MELTELLSHCDHTLLKPTSTWDEIKTIVDEGIEFRCASVCIPASFVKRAAAYAAGRVKICTVIGFPNGYDTTESKCFMAKDALENGADEIDMVINVGALKDGRDDVVLADIAAVRAACPGKVLKVIIECCLLTEEEKVRACQLSKEAGADFVKTSTGFSKGGAKTEDVALMRKTVGPDMGVKASGGIHTGAEAQAMVDAGANRLGTSATLAILAE